MRTIKACDWNGKDQAYLWAETGNGKLYPVAHIRPDYWIICHYSDTDRLTLSYCCHGGTELYIFTSQAERQMFEENLRRRLDDRRKEWNRSSIQKDLVQS
jgi:hypothetical protein